MLSHINVGTGIDISIYDLAYTIKKVTGFNGNIIFDSSKPDGAPRKCIDVSRLSAMGWQHNTSLEQGLKKNQGQKFDLDRVVESFEPFDNLNI